MVGLSPNQFNMKLPKILTADKYKKPQKEQDLFAIGLLLLWLLIYLGIKCGIIGG